MHASGNPGKHVAPRRAHCALEWQVFNLNKPSVLLPRILAHLNSQGKKKKKDGLVYTLMTFFERTIVENAKS